MIDDMGLELVDRIELLEYALPRVIEREQELSTFLLAHDGEKAARCAHTALSAVRLYGSPKLEALLHQTLKLGDTADINEVDVLMLQQELSKEFTVVIDRIRSWLAEHSV